MDKKSVWICVAISVVMLFVAELICLALEIYNQFNLYYAILFFRCISIITILFSRWRNFRCYSSRNAYGICFMALSSFSYIKTIHTQAVKEDEIIQLS
ncbi:MAG: hypothetical protein U0L85_09200 [Bacilli bacterium]|nr:hypothetical protein [Bacilli bacterium]